VETADELTEVEEEEAVVEELPVLVLLLLTDKMPPAGPPAGKVEIEAFLASAMKASSVLPVAGALMEPSMPA